MRPSSSSETRRKRRKGNHDSPIVVNDMKCSYEELLWLIGQLPVCNDAETNSRLPPEILQAIASFFLVLPINMSAVKPVQASSTKNETMPLASILDNTPSAFWISREGTMPRGRGQQFVEFCLAPTLCRLQRFSIRIIPLPMGPISVRTLRLDAQKPTTYTNPKPKWAPISPVWTIENKTGWQTFSMPAADVQQLRVVCLTNQMNFIIGQNRADNSSEEDTIQPDFPPRFTCVGFMTVRFE